jgi:hypothetical protein
VGEPTAVPGGAQETPANDPPPQATAGTTQLVFFDLDETITRHDTLMPYAWGFMLRYTPWRIPLLLGVLPAALEFALRLSDIGTVKESFIRCSVRAAPDCERIVRGRFEAGCRAQKTG